MTETINLDLDSQAPTTKYRIDELCEFPLEPTEYCKRWVDMPQDERGYRKACIASLAEVTGLSPRTINNWGQNFERRPDYVLRILRMADMLNQIRQIVRDPNSLQE